jgi:hypothetical protein
MPSAPSSADAPGPTSSATTFIPRPTPPRPDGRPEDRRRDALARLRSRYGDHVDSEQIEEVYDTAYAALRSAATITTFLPILAERVARHRLSRE